MSNFHPLEVVFHGSETQLYWVDFSNLALQGLTYKVLATFTAVLAMIFDFKGENLKDK